MKGIHRKGLKMDKRTALIEMIIQDLQGNPSKVELLRARSYLHSLLEIMQTQDVKIVESERINA